MIVSEWLIASLWALAPQSANESSAPSERVAAPVAAQSSALERVLTAIELERARWVEQGLVIEGDGSNLDSATQQAFARESTALLERIDRAVLVELRERESRDSRRHLGGDDLLRCALFATASEALTGEALSGEVEPSESRTGAASARDLTDANPATGRSGAALSGEALLSALRDAAMRAKDSASERSTSAAGEQTRAQRELDPCVASFRPLDRALPYVVFAALHDERFWTAPELSRGKFLGGLLYLGEEDPALGGAVLLALSRPLASGAATRRDPTRRTATHLAGVERNRRPVGFEQRHLDVALDIDERARKDESALGPWRRQYAERLLLAIRDEVATPAPDQPRFGDPSGEIAAWTELARTLPWPDLRDRIAGLLQSVANDSFSHPSDEALRDLAIRKTNGALTPEERAIEKKLKAQRFVDVRASLIGILAVVEPQLPAEQAIACQVAAAKDLAGAGKEALLDEVLSRSLGRTFGRDPQAAKDLLDRAQLGPEGASDPFAERIAIESIFKSPSALPGARESAIRSANESLDGATRFAALAHSAFLSAQESEQLASQAIDDLVQNPVFAKGENREQLNLGLISHVLVCSQKDETGRTWASETAFRSFERGLWQQSADTAADDTQRGAIAAMLSDAQVQSLAAMGRLPGWVKELRAKH